MKIQCLVHQYTNYSGQPVFQAHANDMSSFDGFVLVGPAEFEFEVPETFNPVQAEIAALEKKLSDAADEYHRNAAMIRDRISKLQCIENSPTGDL